MIQVSIYLAPGKSEVIDNKIVYHGNNFWSNHFLITAVVLKEGKGYFDPGDLPLIYEAIRNHRPPNDLPPDEYYLLTLEVATAWPAPTHYKVTDIRISTTSNLITASMVGTLMSLPSNS